MVPGLGGVGGKVDVAAKGNKLGVSKVVKAANQKGRVGGKGVDFDGVFGAGSGLSLKVTLAGVKEVLTLGDRPGANEVVQFRSKLSLTGVKSRVTGAGIEFVDGAGKVAFSAPQGVMWDSSSADRDRTRKAVVSVVLDGDVLVARPDMGWLRDPLTVFPVFIDPTINVEATRRVYVEANNPNIAFQTAPEFINGGFSGNTVRTFERLDVSQYAGSAAAVNQAVLHSRLQYCEPGYGQQIRFSKVVSGAGQFVGNAILNGGFEQSGSTPSGAAGWVSRVGYGSATRNTGSVLGAGEYGMRLVPSGFGHGWMAIGSEPFAVTPGEALFVQADLRHANGGFWGIVRVEYYSGVPASGWGQMTDGVLSAFNDPLWSNSNGTQAGTVTVPPAVKWGRVTIHHNGPALDVDNVKVLRDANSLVANASFSAGGGGWSLRTGAGNFGFDNSFGWINSNGGWNAMASTPVAVVAGEELTASAELHSPGGGTSVVRVEFYGSVPAAGWDQFTDNVMGFNVDVGATSAALPFRTVGGVTTVPVWAKWARLSVHHSGPGTTIAIDSARITRRNPDLNAAVTTWNTQPAVENAAPKLANNNYQLVPFDVDVTDWVKGWIDNPATNFGLRMDLDGTGHRCSLAGGWVSIVYNEEPFEPIQPATANMFVNAGFESGGYQWGSCVNPTTVAITAEYGPTFAATGKRYGKVVAQNGTSYACQRAVYRTNGSGMRKMTVTAKLKSAQSGVVSQFIIDQQGPPWQGALFAQRQVNTTLNANGWQTVTLSMCETSTQNSTVSAYVGSQTPGAAVFVDDLTITMADDPQTWDQGGCGGQQPINPGGGGGGPTQPPAPDGAHYFNGEPTPLQWAVDSDLCIAIESGLAVMRSGAAADTESCEIVVPTPVGGDVNSADPVIIGWLLQREGDRSKCVGRVQGFRLGILDCYSASGRFTDNALIFDSPGQDNLSFPLRLGDTGGNPPNFCAEPGSAGSTVQFVSCASPSPRLSVGLMRKRKTKPSLVPVMAQQKLSIQARSRALQTSNLLGFGHRFGLEKGSLESSME